VVCLSERLRSFIKGGILRGSIPLADIVVYPLIQMVKKVCLKHTAGRHPGSIPGEDLGRAVPSFV
jgi:hypothetical protein